MQLLNEIRSRMCSAAALMDVKLMLEYSIAFDDAIVNRENILKVV